MAQEVVELRLRRELAPCGDGIAEEARESESIGARRTREGLPQEAQEPGQH